MNKVLRYAAPMLFVVAACGGSTPTQAPTPKAPETSTPVPEPTTPPAADTADAAAAAPVPTTKPKTTASGAVVPIYTGISEPQTVGTIGAVFRLDDGAELKIPSGWYNASRNILFSIDKKARGSAGKLGVVYEIHVQMPDTQYRVGEESPSESVTTQSEAFVVKLPLPKGTEAASLAIETIAQDPKTKRNKSTWVVVGQTKVETADTGSKAVFEINTLPDGHVHLTSSAPGGAAAP